MVTPTVFRYFPIKTNRNLSITFLQYTHNNRIYFLFVQVLPAIALARQSPSSWNLFTCRPTNSTPLRSGNNRSWVVGGHRRCERIREESTCRVVRASDLSRSDTPLASTAWRRRLPRLSFVASASSRSKSLRRTCLRPRSHLRPRWVLPSSETAPLQLKRRFFEFQSCTNNRRVNAHRSNMLIVDRGFRRIFVPDQ